MALSSFKTGNGKAITVSPEVLEESRRWLKRIQGTENDIENEEDDKNDAAMKDGELYEATPSPQCSRSSTIAKKYPEGLPTTPVFMKNPPVCEPFTPSPLTEEMKQKLSLTDRKRKADEEGEHQTTPTTGVIPKTPSLVTPAQRERAKRYHDSVLARRRTRLNK